MTHGRRQPESGDAPASDFARHSTPHFDSSHTHTQHDEGNLKLAAPLPGEVRFDAGEGNTAAELRVTVETCDRKRGRGEKTRGRSHAYPRRNYELGWGRGGARRPESARKHVGVREGERRGDGDAGVLGSIPCAGAASATWRRGWSKRGGAASFTAGESTTSTSG